MTLRAGGPHYYGLRYGSTVGGEVYEYELLSRLPQHGVELELGLPRGHDFETEWGGSVAGAARRTERAGGAAGAARGAEPSGATSGARPAGGPDDAPLPPPVVAAPRTLRPLPPGWTITTLPRPVGVHWTRAPFVFAPYAVRLLREGRVDLLRGHSVRHTGPALLLARALTRSRVPIVLHHHHLFPRWARLEAAIARRADAVVTVSAFSRDELVAHGVPAERVHVVQEGVVTPPRTDGWPEAWPGPGLRLLFLGRLEDRKRPDLAIDTLAALRRDGVDATLAVAGEGDPAALEARARAAGVAEAVRFTGFVSEADKWRLYDSADVLLFGSVLEGFGLVVAEAQSRGVPVVAAAGTATAEALADGRSGFLTAADPAAFAAKVRELAEDGRRAAFAEAAREHARRFDWDACAAGVAAVYRGLL